MVKNALRKSFFAAVGAFGIYKLFAPYYSGIGCILMFHRVVEGGGTLNEEGDNVVSTGFLETVIRYFIAEGYDIVSLDDVYDILTATNTKRTKFVAFTFDDGYRDTHTLAYPVFRRYGLPLAVYISTSFPDKKAVLWWYGLKDLVIRNDSIVFRDKGTECRFSAKTKDEKKTAYRKIRDLIRRSSWDQETLLRNISDPNGMNVFIYSEGLTLNWDQIREMSRDERVIIGAHTVSHRALSVLPSEEARDEISTSKKIIESHIGKEVMHFAYPYGSRAAAGRREFELAKEFGFKTMTTTRGSNLFKEHREHLECLPRFTMEEGDVSCLNVLTSGTKSAFRYGFKRVISA